jgi:hypothetical protein
MANRKNYQIILDKELEKIKNFDKPPKLLLHSCCAPCSSYVLEYLSEFFEIIIYYFNPNISPESEYLFRLEEVKRLVEEMPHKNPITFVESEYNPDDFFSLAKGHEKDRERGERCRKCLKFRLESTAKKAKELNVDYFTTTLSISPLKDSEFLNETGRELSVEYGVQYLFSDFKKKGGYQRSIVLSRDYNLYRQNFCGCVYSKKVERE